MAKKPSPAELKKEGEELSKQVAEIRKKDLNFAMVMGKDTLVFMTDRKKNPDILWRNAKKEAGGSKGAKGVVSMSGKVMTLDCDDPDSVPAPLFKMAKTHFSDRGVGIRIQLKEAEAPEPEADEAEAEEQAPRRARREEPAEDTAPPRRMAAEDTSAARAEGSAPPPEEEGNTEDSGGADTDAQMDALREQLMRDFKALKPRLDAVEQSDNAGLKKKSAGLARMFLDQIEGNVKKAHAVIGLLQTTLTAAQDSGDIGAPDTVAEAAPDNSASLARRKKLAALERGVDKLLERMG